MPTNTIQTSDQVRQLFDRIAPTYDGFNQQLSFGLHQVWKVMAVDWSRPPVAGRVLDLCCGSGDLTIHLARRVGRHGSAVGLDFSESLLAIARQRSQFIEWQLGDALHIPFPDAEFSAVTMGYGLRNVTDIPTCLQEIWRVLKPGSWVAILDFQHPSLSLIQQFQRFYLDQIVVSQAAAAGLEPEYAYILASLEGFPTGSEQVKLAQAIGFGSVRFYELALGLMGVLVAQK